MQKGKETVMSDVADGKTTARRRGQTKACFSPGSRGRRQHFPLWLWVYKWQQSNSENKGRGKWQIPLSQSRKMMPSQHDDTTMTYERAIVLSLVILMISGAYLRHLKASQITQERKTWATYTDMSLFGLKRTRCAES